MSDSVAYVVENFVKAGVKKMSGWSYVMLFSG